MRASQLIRLEHYFRPWLSRFIPSSQLISSYSLRRSPFLDALACEKIAPIIAPQRPVELWGLKFRNDISNAAGFDKDGKLLAFNHAIGAGYTIVGTVLNRTHAGNLFSIRGQTFNPWTPLPHSHSAINSLGLPGKGINPVLDHIKAFQDLVQPVAFPIGLSVMGHPAQKGQAKIDGVIECMEKAMDHVDFIEINESCPNVEHHSAENFYARIKAIVTCRNQHQKKMPLWVKFGEMPSTDTIVQLDRLGVQAISLLNTQKDYDKIRGRIQPADRRLFDFYTKNYKGGISGKAIFEDAMEAVSHSRLVVDSNHLKIQIVHVGGLFTKEDMDNSRLISPLRQWYTGLMHALGEKGVQNAYPSLF